MLRTIAEGLTSSNLPGEIAPLAAAELRGTAIFIERGTDLPRMGGRLESLALVIGPYIAPHKQRELWRIASVVAFEGTP